MTRRRAALGLVAPFVVLPLLARLAIAPVGDSLAAAMGRMAPAPPSAFVAEEPEEVAFLGEPVAEHHGEGTAPPRRVARLAAPVSSAKRDAGAPPQGGTIAVPSSVIEKAIADRKASARDVVDADGKPFGAKLRHVSRYHAGLQDGDIVIEVAGTRVHSVGEMTQVGMSAIAGGASKISGKIVRGEATFDVVLELPPRT